MNLNKCLLQFFNQYLSGVKGASAHTAKAYRDTFTLFLPFAAQHRSCTIGALEVEHLTGELILDFLDYLEKARNNKAVTRNLRLAAFKSLAKMLRILHPEQRGIAERLLNIPQKRVQKKLIGFLSQDEILKVFAAVDLRRKEGFRDYTILHLLFDAGARASEITTLNLDYLDPHNKTLAILGKGNRYRLIELWPKTVQLLQQYIGKHRSKPKPGYGDRLFINQRGEELTRHGIYTLCKKYLRLALPPHRTVNLHPAHSFRHACAMNMLASGDSLTDIKNRLGHENIQSTMLYLRLNLTRKREVQKKFIDYMQTLLPDDQKIEELVDWQNKKEILTWLDNL
jgi:site-specific recombinase XerD